MHSDISGWLTDPEVTSASETLVLFTKAKYFLDLPLAKKKKKTTKKWHFLMTHQSHLPFCFYLFYLFFLFLQSSGMGTSSWCGHSCTVPSPLTLPMHSGEGRTSRAVATTTDLPQVSSSFTSPVLQPHSGAAVHAQVQCAWGTRWL